MADLQAAIKRIETSRQTHIEWRDYWLSIPGCEDCEGCKATAEIAGDLERQVRVIAEYDNVLDVLRSHTQRDTETAARAWDEGLAASYAYPEPPNPYRADSLATGEEQS